MGGEVERERDADGVDIKLIRVTKEEMSDESKDEGIMWINCDPRVILKGSAKVGDSHDKILKRQLVLSG